MYILYDKETKPFSSAINWQKAIDRLRMTPATANAFVKRVRFGNRSRVDHVYGNSYACFDCLDRQVVIHTCAETIEKEPYAFAEAIDFIPYPPGEDEGMYISEIIMSNGTSAKWQEDETR